jgi:phosphoglycerate dehydrogenase-like enzyme
MTKPNVTILSARGDQSFSDEEKRLLAHAGSVRYIPCLEPLPSQRLAVIAPDTEVLGLTRRATRHLNVDWLGTLPRLRGIAVYSTGYEWIDMASLAAKGIQVAYLPDYSTITVAEHAMGMLLMLSRRLHLSHSIACGFLPSGISLRGWELAGKTIGIIGLGRIGRAIAMRCAAFGINVIVHDPVVRVAGWMHVSLDRLLAQSSIVMLAASQQRGARPLLDKTALAYLQRGAWLVNPSRSSLVDHSAVIDALRNGRLQGYAVDDRVFGPEELAGIEPGRVVQTMHTAWYSDEAMARGTTGWVRRIVALARNEPMDLVPFFEEETDD